EYRECVTRCRTWSTSASNLRVWAVAVVMGLAVAAGDTGCRYARAHADFKRRDFCPARRGGAAGYGAGLARHPTNDAHDPNRAVPCPRLRARARRRARPGPAAGPGARAPGAGGC